MAPRHALHCAPRTAKRAILIDRVNRVLTAGRMISALPAKELAERRAIKNDELDQQPPQALQL
jgi:hypothetical protein